MDEKKPRGGELNQALENSPLNLRGSKFDASLWLDQISGRDPRDDSGDVARRALTVLKATVSARSFQNGLFLADLPPQERRHHMSTASGGALAKIIDVLREKEVTITLDRTNGTFTVS